MRSSDAEIRAHCPVTPLYQLTTVISAFRCIVASLKSPSSGNLFLTIKDSGCLLSVDVECLYFQSGDFAEICKEV